MTQPIAYQVPFRDVLMIALADYADALSQRQVSDAEITFLVEQQAQQFHGAHNLHHVFTTYWQ